MVIVIQVGLMNNMSDKSLDSQFSNFRGLYSKDDSGLIPSTPETGVYASAIQNAICADGTITFGLGYVEENDGSSVTTHQNGSDSTFIRNEYRLKRRDGVTINVAQLNNGKLEWLNTVLNRYETLLTGLTIGVDVGMVDFNKTAEDKTYFCDGVNNMSFWTKAICYYASDDGVNVLTVTVPNSAHTSLSLAGFSATGSLTLKDGTVITYSGISGMTFTGCSALPSTPTVGDGIAQTPDTSTITSANAKGRILFVYQGKLGVVLEASPTIIYLSETAVGTNWTVDALIGGPKILNIIDGNGRINGVIPFKKRLVILKEGGIISVVVEIQSETTAAVNIEPIVISDNVGPSGIGQTLTGLDEVYWISDNDKDIKTLSNVGVEKDINLTAKPLSDDVRKTLDNFDLLTSRLTVHKSDAYLTAKSTSGGSLDTIVHFDTLKRTFYFHKIPGYNFWFDSSNNLYFTDPNSVKSYKLFSGYNADSADIAYLWKSGRLNFGTNFYKKESNLFAVFGKMTTASTLRCRLDYNNGSLGALEWDIKGDGTSITSGKYILETAESSPYGTYPYGIQPYGGESTEDVDSNYFLFFKSLPANINPYDVSVSFSASGDSNYIKVISFGLNPRAKREVSRYRRA